MSPFQLIYKSNGLIFYRFTDVMLEIKSSVSKRFEITHVSLVIYRPFSCYLASPVDCYASKLKEIAICSLSNCASSRSALQFSK